MVIVPAEQFTLFVLIETKCTEEAVLVADKPELPSTLILPPVWLNEEPLAMLRLPFKLRVPFEIVNVPEESKVLSLPPAVPIFKVPEERVAVPVEFIVNPKPEEPVTLTVAPLTIKSPSVVKLALLFNVPPEAVKVAPDMIDNPLHVAV